MATRPPECPLCGGKGSSLTFPFGTVWDGRRFDYLRCRSCASSFLHPLPATEDFQRIYAQSNYHDRYYELIEEETATFLPGVISLLKPRGRMLDFGCGNGAFLMAARQAGFECDGVELDEKTREQAARNSGCEVLAFEALMRSARQYDIIHLGDVLEHLPAPMQTMRELETFLRDDGVFFIEGPLEDNKSLVLLASRLFGAMKMLLRRPLHADLPPYHLFRATARAQRDFFEKRLGYQVRGFLVDESGWPYLNSNDRLLSPGSAGRLLKILIGKGGIATARIVNAMGLQFGNRFAVVAALNGAQRAAGEELP